MPVVNWCRKVFRVLISGIAVMLFSVTVLGASVVSARADTGNARSDIALIPVVIENPADSQIKIEQLYGPVKVLPTKSQVAPDQFGKYLFQLDFSSPEVKDGDVYKYRITEVSGVEDLVSYNVDNKSYIAEIWVVEDSGSRTRYARTFLYEGTEPLPSGIDDSITKPDKCLFRNEKIIGPPATPTPIKTETPAKPYTPSATATGVGINASTPSRKPFTGDVSSLLLYSGLLLAGVTGFIVVLFLRRRDADSG